MEADRRVSPLTNAEVRLHAKKLRDFFGLKDATRVDVIDCLQRPRIWTVRGERPLNFQIRPDDEMAGADGRTTSRKSGVLIELKQSIFEKANMGEGRSRNTIAHEFGHAVLHEGIEMPRLAVKTVTPAWIPSYESAEHQVKVFAPAFLINDDIAATLPNSTEISVEFGISFESADIYYNELLERRERAQTARRIRAFAAEFGEKLDQSRPKIRYLEEPCSSCGSSTVFPVGTKFMCQSCNALSDRFQDGDPGPN